MGERQDWPGVDPEKSEPLPFLTLKNKPYDKPSFKNHFFFTLKHTGKHSGNILFRALKLDCPSFNSA